MKMKKTIVYGFLAVILTLAFTACSKSGGGSGGGGKSLNSPTELNEYLDKQPANSPDNPIRVAMKANDNMLGSISNAIGAAGKYVSLDLSGSPLTEIPPLTFLGCSTLVGIIIPNGVTNIVNGAFADCENLTRVTFQGTMAFDTYRDAIINGHYDAPFDGDLRGKYLAGGIGTYTRASGSYTWTKQ